MVRTSLALLAALTLSTPLSAAASAPVPATYPTREEAEKAARLHFHCTGAHRMGSHWMPCAEHAPGGGHPAASH